MGGAYLGFVMHALSLGVVEMGSVGWLSVAVVDDDGGGGRDDGSRMA